jgi:hypothetical protein
MAKVVIAHAVVDVERCLQGKAERAAEFGTFATNVTDHVAADGSNNVAITADIHDMAGAQAGMDWPSPEGAATAERHGVIPLQRSTSSGSPGRRRHRYRPLGDVHTQLVTLSRDCDHINPGQDLRDAPFHGVSLDFRVGRRLGRASATWSWPLNHALAIGLLEIHGAQ